MQQQLKKERRKLLASIDSLLDGPMVFLGFVWLILLIIELVWALTPALELLSLSIWVVFIMDFLLKWILAPEKGDYLKKNWLTALSLVIPALRVFRIVRLIRLLRGLRGIRLIRVVSSINRGMKSLGATMRRRAFGYVTTLVILVTFAGAAGMYAIEKQNTGFETYGRSLWWTAMRIITAGSAAEPITGEGRALAFLLALFGYAIFGYVTATIASFFIGRDAQEANAPVAGSQDIIKLQQQIAALTQAIQEMQKKTV